MNSSNGPTQLQAPHFDQPHEENILMRALGFIVGEHPFWDDLKRFGLTLLPKLAAASIFGCLLAGLPLFLIFAILNVLLSVDEETRLERVFLHEYGTIYVFVFALFILPKLLSWVFDEAMLIELRPPASPQSLIQSRKIAEEVGGQAYQSLAAKDYKNAMKFFRKAAAQGYAFAEYNIGLMYQRGRGVPQDNNQAMQWYRNAVHRGSTDDVRNAAINIGLMYAEGEGVTQDYTMARHYFWEAEDQQSDQARSRAQYYVGVLYDNGWGAPQDRAEAVRWWRKAADHGHVSAQFNIALSYEKGSGLPQDYEEALNWYRKAADQGDASAQFNIGVFHENGFGVPQDLEQARHWYNLAAEQGHEEANQALSKLAAN